VRLADGRQCDQYTLTDDFVHLARCDGVFLYEDLLAVVRCARARLPKTLRVQRTAP